MRSLVPAAVRAEYAARTRSSVRDRARDGRAARRARRPLRHRAGAGQPPGPDRGRRGARARRERHEGRARGRARARARARRAAGAAPSTSALLLFGKEELPPQHSPLPALFERSPLVHEAALAILLEPTDSTIQAGCLGNMNARLAFHGVSGHSARPWLPRTRSTRRSRGSRRSRRSSRATVEVGGLTFTRGPRRVTRIEAGIADNVVPDASTAHVNFRYAPDRTPESAEAYLRSLVPAGAELEIAGDSPPAASSRDSPLVAAAARGRRPRGRAEAGVDERGRLHGARHRRGQLRPRRPALRAPPRRARARSPRSSTPTRRCAASSPGSVWRVPLSPVLERQATYPFVRLNQAARRRRGARGRGDRLRHGRPARAHRPADHRRRSRTAFASGWAIRAAAGSPSCARRSPPGRAAASGSTLDPDTHVIPTLGWKEAIFTLRAGRARPRARAATRSSSPSPAIPVYERGALFAGARRLRAAAAARRTASCPTSTRSTRDVEPAARPLGQLPEQPDGRHRAARLLRAAGGAGPRARLRPRLRRGLHGALVRRAARLGAPARRPARTSPSSTRSPSARSMTGYRSGFVAGDPELVAALKAFRPNVGHRAAGVRPAGVGRGVGRRGARRADARRATAASARSSSTLFARKGVRVAGSEATMYLWLAVPERRDLGGVRRAAARARRPRRARLVPRRRPARATSASRSCRPRRTAPRAVAILEDGAVTAGARDRDRRRARPRRAPRGRAGRRRVGRRRRGEAGDPAVLPAAQGGADARSAGSSSSTRSRSRRTTPSAACASCRPGSRATARSSPRASC